MHSSGERELRLYLPKDARCQDCDLRGALREDGTPRIDKWTARKQTSGCMGCGGTGVESELFIIPAGEAKFYLTDKQLFVLERRLGERRFSQRQLAEAMGITLRAVQTIERRGITRLRGVVKSVHR